LKYILFCVLGLFMGFCVAWFLDLVITIKLNTKYGQEAAAMNNYITTGKLPSSFRTRPLLNASVISIIGILILVFISVLWVLIGSLFVFPSKSGWFLTGLGVSMALRGPFKYFMVKKGRWP